MNKVPSTNVEPVRVTKGLFGVGHQAYVAYYTELTGDSYGMSYEWRVIGAYQTERQALEAAQQAKNTYEKDYFNHLEKVYIYKTVVKGEEPQDTITLVE